jgi:hypothetical protein
MWVMKTLGPAVVGEGIVDVTSLSDGGVITPTRATAATGIRKPAVRQIELG